MFLVGMELETGESKGPGSNKRLWTEEEDSKLIGALLDLHNTGKYNAERGFRPGHYVAVEKILAVTLPDSKFKSNPHIMSRMKTLKSHFNIVHDMLHGPNTSGFGYDDSTQCVVAEKPVWDAYLKSHKNARMFKGKPYPYYRELCTIFGKDRATGTEAFTPADVEEELRREEATNNIENDNDDDEIDVSMSFAQSHSVGNTSETSSKKKRKRTGRSTEDMISEVIEKSATIMGLKIESSSERLSRAIEDATINELKLKLNGELMKLPGLSIVERHKAMVRIGCDRDLTQLFFTVNDDEKEEWVKAIIL